MNMILVSLGFVALLWMLLNYKLSTAEAAIEMRESMLDDLLPIMEDEQVRNEWKMTALSLFNLSVNPSLVPFFLKAAIKDFWSRRQPASPSMSDHEREVLAKLIRQRVLKINAVAAPHWYVLIAIVLLACVLLLLVAALFGVAMKRLLKRNTPWRKSLLERRVVNSFFRMAH